MRALFDTNILIDVIENKAEALVEVQRYDDRAISIVSWIEVMVGAPEVKADSTRRFLSHFKVIGLDEEVAEIAAALRRDRRLKLPDAVIWASARRDSRLLVTRDAKDFAPGDPGVRVPYRLD